MALPGVEGADPGGVDSGAPPLAAVVVVCTGVGGAAVEAALDVGC